MTTPTDDPHLREGRRQATIAGWHDTDADVYAIGWAAAKATQATTCVATDPNFLATDPEFCRRCGLACAHTEPCVLVLHTSDGPVCIDAQACSVRREAKGLTADGGLDVRGASLVASWPQLWCPACGNRYDAERVQATHCSCLVPLQPVTLQLVTRRP